MRYLFLIVLWIGLAVYAVVDVLNQREESPHGLAKGLWVAIIILAPIVGALVWIALRWLGSGGGRSADLGPKPPDDDPEYLRWLRDQERRKRGM